MTPITFYFYYFGILLEYRANFRHRNQKISLGDTVNAMALVNFCNFFLFSKISFLEYYNIL